MDEAIASVDAQPAQRQYDRWAKVYDWLWAGYIRETTDALWRAARLRPEERVLDVGCGTGAFAERVLRRHPGQSFVGADVSKRMLAAAREKLSFAPNVRFMQAEATALPFAAASFDVVVSASVLHYLPRPRAALAEAARVLKPGGRLVLLDWCRDFWRMRLMDALLAYVDAAHRQTLSAEALSVLLHETEFELRHLDRFRLGWTWGLMVTVATREEPS